MLKSAWKYFFSKGNLLIFLLVIPSFLIPFVLSPSSLFTILCDMTIQSSSYTNLFVKLFGASPDYFWVGLIGVFLEIFFTSLLFGAIDRHMRTGQFNLSMKRLNIRVNYNLVTSLRFVLTKFIIFLVYQILNLLFFILWASVVKDLTVFYTLSCMSFVLISILCAITYSIIILWPPFMLHTGLTSGNAFRMSFAQIKGSISKIAFSLMMISLPFFIVILLNCVFSWSIILAYLLDAFMLLILNHFYIILMYTIFYEVTGLERMDLQNKKTNIWKIKKGV